MKTTKIEKELQDYKNYCESQKIRACEFRSLLAFLNVNEQSNKPNNERA